MNVGLLNRSADTSHGVGHPSGESDCHAAQDDADKEYHRAALRAFLRSWLLPLDFRGRPPSLPFSRAALALAGLVMLPSATAAGFFGFSFILQSMPRIPRKLAP